MEINCKLFSRSSCQFRKRGIGGSAVACRYTSVAASRPQGEFDRLIGRVALAHGFTLVTHNTRHFADMVGIVLEDWVQEYENEQAFNNAR